MVGLLLLVVMFRGEMKWKRVRVDQCMRCPKEKEGSTTKACGGVGLLPLFISYSVCIDIECASHIIIIANGVIV